jgi:putative hydrolase of the HAD superfamily
MAEKPLRYPTILFDWGDTVMHDHPERTTPMVEWETVEVVDGIAEVLTYLHASGRRIGLATSASISDEDQIRGALARAGLDRYFFAIYCFKNTNLPKGDAFYRHIMDDLDIPATDVLMVGDSFEKDIQVPNGLGIFAIWFNPGSQETRTDERHITVHDITQIIEFFEKL